MITYIKQTYIKKRKCFVVIVESRKYIFKKRSLDL